MASGHTESNGDQVDVQNDQNVAEGGKVLRVTLSGRPVNTTKTGTWKAAPFVYAMVTGNAMIIILVVTLVTFLITYFHQPISTSAKTTTNFAGTDYLLSIFGAFVADSYLGSFWTVVIGAIISGLGLGLLTLIAASPGLHLKPCTPNTHCAPASGRYMAPVYVALYTVAVGGGLVNPNLLSLGGDQFDGSKPAEKKQGIHFFAWLFFFTHAGFLVGLWVGVYLVTDVNPGWGYGFCVIAYTSAFLISLPGFPKFRHRRPAGSFLTRTAQVLVAALRNRNASIFSVPIDDLYDSLPPQSTFPKLAHSNQLRFLDRAAIINEEEMEIIRQNKVPNPWRLCSVRQIEECKRILQLIPIWATLAGVSIVTSQLNTFTITQALTLDRKLGPHFTIPAASIGGVLTIGSIILVPLYANIFVPIVSKGGGWLEGQLNNGGLEKFFWLLVGLLSLNFVAFLIVAYFYKYKYDWYHIQRVQLQ